MQNTLSLDDPVNKLKGTGPKVAEKLSHLGIHKIRDLLFHLPYKYQDRTRIVPIHQLRQGMSVVVEAKVLGAQVVFGKRRSLTCRISDDTGLLTLRFFHFSKAQQQQFSAGRNIRCYGEVRIGSTGIEFIHPEYQLEPSGGFPGLDNRLTPFYPTTDGVNQFRIRSLVEQALALLTKPDSLTDYLIDLPESRRWPSLNKALRTIHTPDANDQVNLLLTGEHAAQERLALEELLAHHLGLKAIRNRAKQATAPVLSESVNLINAMLASLPFQLTKAQQNVCKEISQDLTQPSPMLRLVQGDVGSGKTLVALVAALQAVESGFQVALMAPTELLAEQHFQSFQTYCQNLPVRIELLLGKTAKKQRDQVLPALASGEVHLIIGTHALIQDSVEFQKLGLTIIDEQHRFGVNQRLALKHKARNLEPHQLTMTATPIPRTLAMTLFADMDVSIIDELPPGRTPVKTTAVSQQRREAVIRRVNAACTEGRQVYWVCTLIDESEELQAEAAENTAKVLSAALPDRKISLLHGRMKAQEKSQVMQQFKQGETEILIATTVIEVGVDVPNASVMIIENPERLGLAQLHQLRGRVGRGAIESFCLLLYGSPLSQQGKQRLEVMKNSNDGFVIAEEDLKLRGHGEILGRRQTGTVGFKVADMEAHQSLLAVVPKLAERLSEAYPERSYDLIQRWTQNADDVTQV